MPLLPSLPLTQTPFLRTNRQENCCTGRAKQQDNNNNSIACKISYLLETKEKKKTDMPRGLLMACEGQW